MTILKSNSLVETVDNLNEVFYRGAKIPVKERVRIAEWLVSRQGLPGAYGNTFALTGHDGTIPIHTFTGERVTSNAAQRHIIGEEACRAVLLLKSRTPAVKRAIEAAGQGMLRRLSEGETASRPAGIYCCGICSCSLWRHLTAGGLDRQEQRLAAGMLDLKQFRDSKGRWGKYPFYYTLLALEEIDLPAAVKELQYAAPVCERLLKKSTLKDKFAERRKLLIGKILSKC